MPFGHLGNYRFDNLVINSIIAHYRGCITSNRGSDSRSSSLAGKCVWISSSSWWNQKIPVLKPLRKDGLLWVSQIYSSFWWSDIGNSLAKTTSWKPWYPTYISSDGPYVAANICASNRRSPWSASCDFTDLYPSTAVRSVHYILQDPRLQRRVRMPFLESQLLILACLLCQFYISAHRRICSRSLDQRVLCEDSHKAFDTEVHTLNVNVRLEDVMLLTELIKMAIEVKEIAVYCWCWFS